jgi:hypothetical protein
VFIWFIFPALVLFTKKNLATLVGIHFRTGQSMCALKFGKKSVRSEFFVSTLVGAYVLFVIVQNAKRQNAECQNAERQNAKHQNAKCQNAEH